jgi:uncharacterized protein
LIRPEYRKLETINWRLFTNILLLFYLITFPLSLLINLLLNFLSFNNSELEISNLRAIFAGIIVAPIIEEFLFRFLLIPKYKNLIVFSIFCSFLAFFTFIKSSYTYFYIFVALCLIIFFILLNKRYLRATQFFIIRHYKYYFFLSWIVFGFYHLANYSPLNYKIILFSPIILLPHMVLGSFLGFIRMRFGLMYSILFHAVNNTIPVILLWALKNV